MAQDNGPGDEADVALPLPVVDLPGKPKCDIAAPEKVPTARIHIVTDGTSTAEAIAAAAGAESFKVPHYSPNSIILTLRSAAACTAELARVSALPGVTSARQLQAQQRSRKLIPADALFLWTSSNTNYQWHLHNTGQNNSVVGLDVNIIEAWDSYLGNGITVSVVDDGLQVAHEDLAANVNSAIDHDWNDNSPDDPTPPLTATDGVFDDHGTSCAGVIAAVANNNLGGSGAAPEASLVGLRILGGDVAPDEEAEALAWRTDIIDISNNSWGAADDGENLSITDPLVSAALANSVSNGRGGKGTIYVWSAGNGAASQDYANFDGFINQPETIGVGSINFQGTTSFYSEAGACVVISAPSDNDDNQPGITTTTLSTNGNYTNTFGGTSSAAPLVSGVLALVLEANPNLGWRDVQEVLISSARKVDASNAEWIQNGAGFNFHHSYGAGMIDAGAAIAAAQSHTNLGSRELITVAAPAINQAIPDDNSTGITHTFQVTSDLRAEHVVLTADIDHAYRGDVRISLTSPDGTESILAAESGSSETTGYPNYPFLSVRHWGENPKGTWTLKVSDTFSGDTGTLNSATLQIHGAQFVSSVILGDVNQDGVVNCDDVDSYRPLLDTSATVATAALDLDSSGTIDLDDVENLITNLVVTQPNGVTGTFLGDLNCDGRVDVLDDAFTLVSNLNSSAGSYSQGDINFDGNVDVLGDAFIFISNLGRSNTNP
jgi:subtilisin-like proprotein convertase family protein